MFRLCYGKGQFLWVSQNIAYEVFKIDNGSYLKTGIGSHLYDPRLMVNS